MTSPRLDLFVFADALGWQHVQRRTFLADILPQRSRCDTLLGYTPAPVIRASSPAPCRESHGHFSFFVFDPAHSPFAATRWLGWLPEIFAGHHRVRNRVSRWWQRHLGYTGYCQLYSVPFKRLPWLDYTEEHDLYEPGGIIGGQEAIFAHWQRSGKPWSRSDWRQNDVTNVNRLLGEIREGRVALSYLFTSQLDATMHAHGTTGPAVDAAFERFGHWMRKIESTARAHYDEVRIHLVSDHGMADTTSNSRMLLDFESLGLRYGHDDAAVWDSTMVRFWFPGSSIIRPRVEAWLAARAEGHILSDVELKASGCLFVNQRYGELWYLLNEGTIFAPSFMNQRHVPGMHGFDPQSAASPACWLTNHNHYAAPPGSSKSTGSCARPPTLDPSATHIQA
ncbi:MAG: alkaline phosphatase family protein [Candidatus Synoicihabitans palmerolidicus]|nr:alkaline phosphatase family protein [Candidatus Synoicihabitans palmerolidicus]